MDKQAEGTTIQNMEVISAKCSFKTLKAPKSETVLRNFRKAVDVTFPFTLEAAIDHPRFFPAVRVMISEAAKSMIQEVERKAAIVEGKPEYMHDMQAEANRVNLDALFASILDGAMDKEDVTGWWDSHSKHIREYYKNAKNYDDARVNQTMLYLRGQFFSVHASRFDGSAELQKSLVVVLERMPEHAVRDYLLGKLTGKKQVSEEEGLALIGE